MKMTSEESLPVVLVSTADAASGRKFICELIEKAEEATQEECDEYERIWCIENKYYSARVRVRLRPDGARAPHPPPPAAHVVLLTPEECADGSRLRARAAAAAGGGGGGEVLVAAAACGARAASGTAAEAQALCYELVPLLPGEDDEEDEEDEEERGMARVRAALHAHTWSSLRRHDAAGAAGGVGPERAVERAELFAELLGQLGEAGAARAVGAAREDRLARAEQLVAAFCRALDTDDEDP